MESQCYLASALAQSHLTACSINTIQKQAAGLNVQWLSTTWITALCLENLFSKIDEIGKNVQDYSVK